MALRAGYYGLKKKLLEKVIGIPAIKSIGSGLALNSSTGELSATGVEVSIIGNPEGEATAGDLAKLQIGDDIFNVPDTTYSNATTTEAGLMSPLDKVKLNGLDKDTYFLRSEQAVLGAKNLFNFDTEKEYGTNTTLTGTADDFVIANSDVAGYRNVFFKYLKVKKNTNYKITADVVIASSGQGRIGVRATAGGTNIAQTEYITESVDNVTLNFNSGNNDSVSVFFNSAGSSSLAGSVEYKNVMLTLASDPDDTYAPYAMTNNELTEKVTPLNTYSYSKRSGTSFKLKGSVSYLGQSYLVMGQLDGRVPVLSLITTNSGTTEALISNIGTAQLSITYDNTTLETTVTATANMQNVTVISNEDFILS